MKLSYFAPLLMATASLAGCSDDNAETAGATEEVEGTVATILKTGDHFGTLNAAFQSTGLSTLFDAPGASYTVLAPLDSAFSGIETGANTPPPVLASILREHILPGHLDEASITDAIVANGGPVKMNTVGSGTVEFSLDGEVLTATHSASGRSAKLSGTASEAQNGVILPVDTILVMPPAPDSAGG